MKKSKFTESQIVKILGAHTAFRNTNAIRVQKTSGKLLRAHSNERLPSVAF